MEKQSLTDKQRIFCREYVINWNATQAAIKAGYSEKTAGIIGFENLKKPNIQAYISEIQENIEKAAEISMLKVLLEHKKVAFSNIAELKEDWMTLKEFNDLTEDQKAAISEIKHIRKVYTSEEGENRVEDLVFIKMHDKLKSLEAISKMLGYNKPDVLDHTGEIKITVEEKVMS